MPRGSTDKNVGCNHCTDQTIHSAQWSKATRYRLPYRLFAWLVRVGNELPTLPGCARGPKIGRCDGRNPRALCATYTCFNPITRRNCSLTGARLVRDANHLSGRVEQDRQVCAGASDRRSLYILPLKKL